MSPEEIPDQPHTPRDPGLVEEMAEDSVPGGSPELLLSGEEEAATKKFLENVNKWRSARELEEVNISTVKHQNIPSVLKTGSPF